jgi:hypothetical protein
MNKASGKGEIKTHMTNAEFEEWMEEHNGVCLACWCIAYGDCEPDAEGYECASCGAPAVMGAELAFISGHIIIS